MKSTKTNKVVVTQSHFRAVDTSLELIHLPVISFEKLEFDQSLLKERYDWVVITSKNTVNFFYDELKVLDVKHIASIGKTTTQALIDAGFKVDFEPSDYTQEGFKEEFEVSSGMKVLYPASKNKRSIMRDYFKNQGAFVTEIPLYAPVPNIDALNKIKEKIDTIDGITFSSPSGVHTFMKYFNVDELKNLKVISIGHVTQSALKTYGVNTNIPKHATLDSMIKTIEKEFHNEI